MSNKVEEKKMKPAAKRALEPKLRFPEFREGREWEKKRLGELLLASPDYGVNAPAVPYSESLPAYLRITDITEGGYFVADKKVSVGVKVTGENYLADGDIVLARTGASVGKSYKYRKEDGRLVFAGFLIRLKPDPKKINSTFLSNFLFTKEYWTWVRVNSARSGQPGINSNEYASLPIPVPPAEGAGKLLEQQKIADCLTSIDELITFEVRKLDTLKANKKGLMQQLFPAEGETLPKLRFPEFREAGEWEEKKLIDSADRKVKWSFIGGPFGSNLKSSDYVVEGVRIIQLQNIGDAEFVNDYQIFTSEEKADELLSNNIYPGDIILSKMGDPVGRACLIPDAHKRYVMCSDGIRLVVDEELNSKYFIYSLINSIQFRSLVEKTATGSTRKRIGLDELKNLPVLLPKKIEQQKIADCLSSIDELVTLEAQKLDALKAHKKGLMQQLFPALDEVQG